MNDITPSTLIHQTVQALDKKGESKDYIIGFLIGTLAGLAEIDKDEAISYLERTLNQAKR